MKKWAEIEPVQNVIDTFGDTNCLISGIAFDSRKVLPGYLFVAQKGVKTDGHNYISLAIEKGAVVVVCEKLPSKIDEKILYITVDDSGAALGQLAAAWYNHPSEKLKVVGITGTNGKTSIATLLYRLFTRLGYHAGLISTISSIAGDIEEVAQHTTPDALRLQYLLAQMVDIGCDYCFMEVSSHAVVQQRIAGIHFAGGVFTNLTHDHLDYHETFAEYLKAKKTFFDGLSSGAFAITNIDDRNGRVMVQNCAAKTVTCSTWSMADYRCKVIETHFDGMLINFDGQEVWTRFVGNFNASNLLAVYATAKELNQTSEEVLPAISALTPVAGRFETLRSPSGKMAIVDYAHTPDALKNVLDAINELRNGGEKVITVVGAGGDRDKSKRPEMAKEALNGSDLVILTSDNPRTEDPESIISDMLTGVSDKPQKVITISNRKEAIKTAMLMANPGDIILIAGKGHENYQEIHGVKHHFDDREIVKEIFDTENK